MLKQPLLLAVWVDVKPWIFGIKIDMRDAIKCRGDFRECGIGGAETIAWMRVIEYDVWHAAPLLRDTLAEV